MTEKEFAVKLTVPARMTDAEVISDLGTCISFGSPVITKVAADQVASPTTM